MYIIRSGGPDKKETRQSVPIFRPQDRDLEPFFDKHGKLENHAAGHALNTEKHLKNLQKGMSTCLLTGSDSVMAYTGYQDGLILVYSLKQILEERSAKHRPFIGHTNKINQLKLAGTSLYSCAQDCTIRQWNADPEVRTC